MKRLISEKFESKYRGIIMNNKHKTKDDELFEVIAKIKTKDEAAKFFADLCTPGK